MNRLIRQVSYQCFGVWGVLETSCHPCPFYEGPIVSIVAPPGLGWVPWDNSRQFYRTEEEALEKFQKTCEDLNATEDLFLTELLGEE